MGINNVVFTDFPKMGRADIRDLKKGIDESFRSFTRTYGEGIEDAFYPLKVFMVWFEKLLTSTPWPIVIIVIAVLVWFGARSWPLVVGTNRFSTSDRLSGHVGRYDENPRACVLYPLLFVLLIGIPVGIIMSKSDRIQAFIVPILDIMQTIPAFVYLIPCAHVVGYW